MPIHAKIEMRRLGTCRPHASTGASATGTAMTHMAATTALKVHFHGVAKASRAPSAFNSGYHPAAHTMWKMANTSAQRAAAYAIHGPICGREVLTERNK